jgi:indolepyruvate ferredoxin oxidoreductase alpha subunit
MVRITRALVLAKADPDSSLATDGFPQQPPPPFQREFMRWVVLPVNVVPYHRRLHERLETVQTQFEGSSLNGIEGNGPFRVIAAGFAYQKLIEALGGSVPPALSVLRLGTIHPFPEQLVIAFLRATAKEADPVLILEETAPWVERALQATVQKAGLKTPIYYGRSTGHIARTGELFPAHIAAVLNDLVPHLALPTGGETSRPLPSRQPLCNDCPYIPTFDALVELMDRRGGRDQFILVGDPGCMVRAQLPPYELLDIKNSLGSSIGMAVGLALSARETGSEKQIVALSGDSSFLHSGLPGLIDAARFGVDVLVILLDNGTTALSGGQPHPASHTDTRGRPQSAVTLEALARQAGAGSVQVVDLDRGQDARPALEAGLAFSGLAVVVARGECTQ